MCLLHKVKLICLNIMLFNNEVKNIYRMFLQNIYPDYFFDFTLKKFNNMVKQKLRTNNNKNFW